MDFQTIVEDIRNLKIQGAQAVAKASVKALQIAAQDIRNDRKVNQIHNLNKTKQILFKTRPTEPAMRNALNYVLSNIETADDVYTEIVKRVKEVEEYQSKITGISLSQFTKTTLIKAKTKRVYPNFNNHYGNLRVLVLKGTKLRRKINGWIEGLIEGC